jgi:hypothetical protein
MGALFSFNPIYELFTGNPLTIDDAYQATPPFSGYPYPNGARMQPGRAVYYTLISGANYYWQKFRYVRYNPTAAVSLVTGQLPPVYWKDNTFTVVTPTSSEGLLGLNGIAGALLNMSVVSGDWTLVQVAGYEPNLISAASVVAGDWLYGNATAQTVTRIAQGAATYAVGNSEKMYYLALTAISSSVSTGQILVEDISAL